MLTEHVKIKVLTLCLLLLCSLLEEVQQYFLKNCRLQQYIAELRY